MLRDVEPEVSIDSAELTYLLLGDLREFMAERPRTEILCVAMLTTLDRLIDVISNVTIKHSCDDEFSGALSECPQLSPKMELLWVAQRRDAARLTKLRNSGACGGRAATDAKRVIDELADWMRSYCIASQRDSHGLLSLN